MKEIVLAITALNPKDLFKPTTRHAAMTSFCEQTKLKPATANKFFNRVVNDLRDVVPLGQYAMDILDEAHQQNADIDSIVADLKKDLDAIKSGKYDYSLSEKSGTHDAKTDVVEQMIRAMSQKAQSSRVKADIVGKIMKQNVDTRRNELTEESNKHNIKTDIMAFEVLKSQLDGLQGLRKRLSGTGPVIDTSFEIINIKQLQSNDE